MEDLAIAMLEETRKYTMSVTNSPAMGPMEVPEIFRPHTDFIS